MDSANLGDSLNHLFVLLWNCRIKSLFSRQQNLIKFTLEFQECNTDVTAINASEIGVYDAHHKGMANLPPITV